MSHHGDDDHDDDHHEEEEDDHSHAGGGGHVHGRHAAIDGLWTSETRIGIMVSMAIIVVPIAIYLAYQANERLKRGKRGVRIAKVDAKLDVRF